MMFARDGPRIRAKDLLKIPLVAPAHTPPPKASQKTMEGGGESRWKSVTFYHWG